MKSMIGLLFLVAGSLATPAYHMLALQNDGSYKFSYDTGKETGSHSRSEVKRPDGLVIGKFSYEDPTGDLRVVNYQAGDFGYVAKGAVGVAGAPDSQLPAEPEIPSADATDNNEEVNKADEQNGEETKADEQNGEGTKTDVPSGTDDNKDDSEAMKLQAWSEDAGVPDGFPIGFFDQGFHGLRRLPEPTREESEEGKKDDEKEENKSDNDKEKDNKEENKHRSHFEYFPPIVPFQNFHPQTWSSPFYHTASAQQHPVYVYSYQIPQAHGFYYYY